MNERVRLIRENLNLSRAAFGTELGVSGDVINNLERGRVDVKEPMVKLICSVYNVNETWLRTGDGEMFIPTTRSQEIADFVGDILRGEEDNFKRRFVAMLARLNESEWAFIEQKALELFEGTKKD